MTALDREAVMFAIVREHMGVNLAEKPAGIHTPLDDVGADSLDIVELTMAIEDEFGVTIADETIDSFLPGDPSRKTFADLLALAEAAPSA